MRGQRAFVKVRTVVQPTMAQKKICMPSCTPQWVAISSATNKRPPTGAPKAALTPPATPALMKSRRSRTCPTDKRQKALR